MTNEPKSESFSGWNGNQRYCCCKAGSGTGRRCGCFYDGNAALKEEDIKEKFDRDAKVTVVLGEIKRSDLLGVELCIISPGIPLDSPFVAVVDDAKIPILGEIELAYQCGLGKLAAITGTNGKTTTTAPHRGDIKGPL